jgi:hypothetical protein
MLKVTVPIVSVEVLFGRLTNVPVTGAPLVMMT